MKKTIRFTMEFQQHSPVAMEFGDLCDATEAISGWHGCAEGLCGGRAVRIWADADLSETIHPIYPLIIAEIRE